MGQTGSSVTSGATGASPATPTLHTAAQTNANSPTLAGNHNNNNNNAAVSASISTLPSALVSSTAVAEATDASDEEASFNYNSESSEEDYKFPTAVALTLPDAPVPDPLIAIETPLKRVAKDFIGSGV